MALFFLGLALSIPLSIISNIYTPRVQSWIANHSSSRAKKRLNLLADELHELNGLAQHREALNTRLISDVLKVTLISAITAIMSGIFFAIANSLTGPDGPHLMRISNYRITLTSIFATSGTLVGILGSVVVVIICLNSLRLRQRVYSLKEYGTEVVAEMDSLREKINPESSS
ncbi:hypothetical protein [Actinoallomurus sp. CA-142502]|uniref:hypothetical protein n=1 Tax=Actinoallomurus sp. CA-142502 TaxID=3239885 RepID=UPI003D8B5804